MTYKTWKDLSPREKQSDKLRFNRIMTEMNKIEARVSAIESGGEFKVTISLAEAYSNPTVKFDNNTISPNSSGKYVISDVIKGEHSISVTCATYEDYSQTVNCSASSNAFTVTLTPHIINVTATVTLEDEAVEGANVSATGITAVTTNASGVAVLSKQADSISGVTATKTIEGTVYSATSSSTFTEDDEVTLELTAEESE